MKNHLFAISFTVFSTIALTGCFEEPKAPTPPVPEPVLTSGTEFQVNTEVASEQLDSAVAMGANGNFVVVWQGREPPSAGAYNIYAQRYDSAGVAQGLEFQVNTYTTSNQTAPSIAMDANGNFVVAWTSYNQDGDGNGIYAQRFDSVGVAQGAEFQVNTEVASHQNNSAITMDANGNFVVTWHSYGQDGDNNGIYAQRFNASAVAQGAEFQVNTYTTSSQSNSAIASDANGNFVVVWESHAQDAASGAGIYAQRYNSAGVAQGAEFLVNTYTAGDQNTPSIAMATNGNFVVTWVSFGQDGDQGGIYAQRFNAVGAMQGAEFRVNTFTTYSQQFPIVAMDTTGDFVVTWQSPGQDADSTGVFAQRYNALAVAQGLEFQVNTAETNSQNTPAVAMDGNGDFVVTWNTSSGNNIKGKRYYYE